MVLTKKKIKLMLVVLALIILVPLGYYVYKNFKSSADVKTASLTGYVLNGNKPVRNIRVVLTNNLQAIHKTSIIGRFKQNGIPFGYLTVESTDARCKFKYSINLYKNTEKKFICGNTKIEIPNTQTTKPVTTTTMSPKPNGTSVQTTITILPTKPPISKPIEGKVSVTTKRTYQPIPEASEKKITFICEKDTAYSVAGIAPKSELNNLMPTKNKDCWAYECSDKNYGEVVSGSSGGSGAKVFKNVYMYNNNINPEPDSIKKITDYYMFGSVLGMPLWYPDGEYFHPYTNLYTGGILMNNPQHYFPSWKDGSGGYGDLKIAKKGCNFYLYNFGEVSVRIDRGGLKYTIEDIQ